MKGPQNMGSVIKEVLIDSIVRFASPLEHL